MLQTFILIVHIVVALAIVVLVLLQHGKGADMGAAFGSGSAGSLFGASGAANFLSRSTAVCAAIFFATSLGLTYFSTSGNQSGVIQRLESSGPVKSNAADKSEAKPADPAGKDAGQVPTKTDQSKEIPK